MCFKISRMFSKEMNVIVIYLPLECGSTSLWQKQWEENLNYIHLEQMAAPATY